LDFFLFLRQNLIGQKLLAISIQTAKFYHIFNNLNLNKKTK